MNEHIEYIKKKYGECFLFSIVDRKVDENIIRILLDNNIIEFVKINLPARWVEEQHIRFIKDNMTDLQKVQDRLQERGVRDL